MFELHGRYLRNYNGGNTGTTTKTATLTYNNIKINIDGKEIIPTDVNGNYVAPFVIDGTTYLPVRAVAGALGLGVEWDGATNTIRLTSGVQKTARTGSAPAKKGTQQATLTYSGIKIVLDGKTITPKDVSGTVVNPFAITAQPICLSARCPTRWE